MRRAKTLFAASLLALGATTLEPALAASSGPSTRAESPRPTPTTDAEKAREADFEKAEYLIKADKCDEAIPLLAEKTGNPDALIYVCRDFACQRPVSDLDEFRQFVQPE